MNVQHFTGKNMRAALASVREALGEDALILETKQIEDGFEVSAVAEYDPEELAAALVPKAQPTIESASLQQVAGPRTDTEQAILAAAEKLARANDVGAVRAEMQSIRSLVESHLARVGWSETELGSPAKASIMRNLTALGIAPDVVSMLVAQIDIAPTSGQAWAAPMRTLMNAIPFDSSLNSAISGVVAIVGPSGAGKTTTIAKLAARHVIEHSADDVAIVSLDNHRLGASEQIDVLGRILGVPVHRPSGDRGLEDVAKLVADKALVLVDTVGMGQHDRRLSEQLSRLRLGDRALNTLLALPANLEHAAMQEVVDAYRQYDLRGCVLTKIDEAATLGAAMSVVIRSGLPLCFLADGQQIPEDLHAAEPRRAWLIKHAIELMRARKVSVSNQYMSENFYRVAGERLA
jgi:flagellar biosynthesis protein FlhF